VFRRPSLEWAKRTETGLAGQRMLADVIPAGRRLPIQVGNDTIGAVGVSGASGGQGGRRELRQGRDRQGGRISFQVAGPAAPISLPPPLWGRESVRGEGQTFNQSRSCFRAALADDGIASTALERLCVARFAKLAGDSGSRSRRATRAKRLQVIGAGAPGASSRNTRSNRLAVERLEIDRPLQPREQSEPLPSFGSLPCGMATPLPTPVEP